ncbi:UNVERIFIED_CONTAM: hypothetical protein HDU68_008092 [Siphonaria sp. JEL0065]|nr:hypothetical protein HDU68_008092 [Siphonaria sp. JEL0065]
MLSFLKNLIGSKNEETAAEIAAAPLSPSFLSCKLANTKIKVTTRGESLFKLTTLIQPLDAVLWAATDPKDPLASIIKRIELHECVPKIEHPFHELWTHSGIIVDKTVLPLDCLEDGKLYVFESVMAGQIAGIMFCPVLPVDHPTKEGGFHLGPQIRELSKLEALIKSTCDWSSKVINNLKWRENWIKVPSAGGVPQGAFMVAGIDSDGVELFVARVKIGSAYRITPHVGYFNREIPINYAHEVLANLNDTVWAVKLQPMQSKQEWKRMELFSTLLELPSVAQMVSWALTSIHVAGPLVVAPPISKVLAFESEISSGRCEQGDFGGFG